MKTGARGKIAYIDDAHPATAPALWRWAFFLWRRLVRMTVREPRRLRLCESLPLGDRRFVAVIEFEKARFLVGGTSGSLSLLARLGHDRNPIGPHTNHSAPAPKTEEKIEAKVEEKSEKESAAEKERKRKEERR